MINCSARQASNRLGVQLMVRKRGIEDSRILEGLNMIDWEEGYFSIHQALFDTVPSIITFDFEEEPKPSEEMIEFFEEQCEYMTLFSFCITKLAAYKDHPLFIKLMQGLQFEAGCVGGDFIEVSYLPCSEYSNAEEDHVREYAKQPFTFHIGVYDSGYIEPSDMVDFLDKLIVFNERIEELLR